MAIRGLVLLAMIVATGSPWNLQFDSDNQVQMTWSVTNGSDQVAITVSAKSGGYVAIGFSHDGNMVGSFAMIGWVDGASQTSLLEYTLDSKFSLPTPVSDPILTDTSVDESAGITTMSFTRKASHISRPIYTDRSIHMIWAINPSFDGLAPHTNQGSKMVNLGTGDSSDMSPPASIIIHGICMVIAYVLCFPAGVIVARFFRSTGSWMQAHRMIQVMGFILAIAGLILAIVFTASINSSHFQVGHPLFGLIMIAVTTSQIIVANLRPSYESSMRLPWVLFHIIVGIFIFFIGPLIALSGLLTLRDLYMATPMALVAVAVVVVVVIWVGSCVLEGKKRFTN